MYQCQAYYRLRKQKREIERNSIIWEFFPYIIEPKAFLQIYLLSLRVGVFFIIAEKEEI